MVTVLDFTNFKFFHTFPLDWKQYCKFPLRRGRESSLSPFYALLSFFFFFSFFLFLQIYFEITFSISFSPLLFFSVWCSFLYSFRMDFWLASFPGTRSRGKVNSKIFTGFFSNFFLFLFVCIKTLSEKNAIYQLKLNVWKVWTQESFLK